MYPILLKVWIFEFHTYTVMMASAFLLGVYLFFRYNDRLEKPFPVSPIGALLLFVGALVGSKVYYALEYEGPAGLLGVYRIWEGGLVAYGGLIGGTLAAFAYLWWHRVPIRPISDLVLSYLPLCHAVGRLGCFFNGCCYGAPTNLPWGIVYPEGGATHTYLLSVHKQAGVIAADALRAHAVHPTALYEILGLLTLFLVLWYRYPRRRFQGEFLVLYPGMYGVVRFLVECFRADSTHYVAGMRLSQFVSLLLVCLSAAVYAGIRFYLARKTDYPEVPCGQPLGESSQQDPKEDPKKGG